MPRHASLHPIKKKASVEFVQDWTELLEAANGFYRSESPFWKIDAERGAIIHDYVPKLIEQYTELWGLASALMKSVEDLQNSRDTLYVPDAQELIGGLK